MNNSRKLVFFLLISLWLQFNGYLALEASDRTIEKQIQNIKQKFNVQVHYLYSQKEYFPKGWLKAPISAEGGQLSYDEVKRILPLIQKALSAYPKPVLNKNLQNIYLLNKLNFYGKSFGATNSKTSLYIKSQGVAKGYSDSFIVSRIHSEFSSILMRNYKFPKEKWEKINPNDFNYLGSGKQMLSQKKLYGQSQELLSRGFLIKYSQSSIENDFNIISDWLFTRYSQLNELGKKHEKIRMKTNLAKKFYKSINQGFYF